MFIVIVALKPIAAEFMWSGQPRHCPTPHLLIGFGMGGIAMGWISDRISVVWPVLLGSAMLGVSLAVASASTSIETLILTHGC